MQLTPREKDKLLIAMSTAPSATVIANYPGVLGKLVAAAGAM